MKDIQSTKDNRKMPINKVGICDFRHPVNVLCQSGDKQSTIATTSLSVNLQHDVKGTHMSRLIEAITRNDMLISHQDMHLWLIFLCDKLGSSRAYLESNFPFFVDKYAPVSSMIGKMDYDCHMVAQLDAYGFNYVLEVTVPVTSLCPCSKEISDRGAHNQRSRVSIAVKVSRLSTDLWIEDIIKVAEDAASAPLYSLLKRPDEKYVTEQAYDNPVFVEDLVRSIAVNLVKDKRIIWFHVKSVNEESIHNHNAFAEIMWPENEYSDIKTT